MGTVNINIFVSSTCYDLSQIRKDIRDFIAGLGHNPILSEQNDFQIDPQLDNWENCINAVKTMHGRARQEVKRQVSCNMDYYNLDWRVTSTRR